MIVRTSHIQKRGQENLTPPRGSRPFAFLRNIRPRTRNGNSNKWFLYEHKYFTEHKTEYKEWKLKQMGQKAYDRLEVVANATGKKDFKLMRIVWRAALRDLEEKLVRRIKT